jgi:DNA ligase D-like protein (predicted 3'-phosphoesterase)
LYDGEAPVFIGKVGTGFSEEIMANLKQILDNYKVEKVTLPGVDNDREITWLRAGVVVEVGYQTITEDEKLRIPVFRNIRDDKEAIECTIDQIRPALSDYTTKRDFSRTPEPAAIVEKSPGKSFVIHEHHARRLHFDLRLEKDGVLKSWAVPKVPPQGSGDRRLAVQVEDHPLEYGKFEGTIPEGQYGARTVKIWDKGQYEPIVWGESKIEILIPP